MKLRVVPTKAHAAVDHVVGPTLVFAPELFGLKSGKKDALPPRATGTAQAIYSNLTDYELSVKRLLPMKAHLAMDAAAGAVLGSMPWLLGTRRRGLRHWLPHAVVGGMEIGLALTTKTEPKDRHRPDERLRYAFKAAKHPETWSAIGKTGMTVATWSPLRKASRKLARLAA
ncbi:MAG TPA: hypothetical protein VFI37_09435 [Gaiellaceae bacterium]|jgi:hypothetical protein|nr:hypothetical protein [Gaiellaceae bacterium]